MNYPNLGQLNDQLAKTKCIPTRKIEIWQNSKLTDSIQESSEFEDCDQGNIEEWLECDAGSHQLLMDDEIFTTFMEDPSPSEDHETEENLNNKE